MSTPTSSNGINAAPQPRPAIGREIPDNPASLAAASPAKLPTEPSQATINSGLTVGSQVTVGPIKPVDSKTLAGSYPGDHRSNPGDVAKSSLDSCADNGGPRKDVGQFKGSKNESQPKTQSFTGNLADSDAGN